MGFPTSMLGTPGQQFATETTIHGRLGRRMNFPDGRVFRWAEMAGTAAVAARLYQSSVPVANWVNENPTAAAVAGATVCYIDNATKPAVDDWKDGYLLDETNGHTYLIKHNTAEDPAKVTLWTGLKTDLAAADTVGIIKSPYKDVIIHPGPATQPIVGVAPWAITANAFAWLQVHGVSTCLMKTDTAVNVVGDGIQASESTAGAAGLFDMSANTDAVAIGTTIDVGSDGTVGHVFLFID